MIYQKRKTCAICGNRELNLVLDYGDVPAAGSFPLVSEIENEPKYQLGLEFCDNCGLLQTNSILDGNYLFDYKLYEFFSEEVTPSIFTPAASKLSSIT